MSSRFNRRKVKEIIRRHATNRMGLLLILFFSLITTVIAAIRHFKRVDVLCIVTLMLAVLVIIQNLRSRYAFTTLPHFRGKKKHKEQEDE